MNIRILILILSFCIARPLSAQIRLTNSPAKAVKYFKEAEIELLNKNYEKALKLYEKSLKIKPGISAAHRGIAACYVLLNDYDNALYHYEHVLGNDSLFSRILYFETADAHYKAGNYEAALEYFNKFNSMQEKEFIEFGANGKLESEVEADYLSKMPGIVRACEVLTDSARISEFAKLSNMGPGINSISDEYFPFVSNDEKLMFYTRRKNENADENLYFSEFRESWEEGIPFKNFNTPAHEGRFTMVRNGRKMYFTTCNRKGVQGPCDIWEGEVENMNIQSIKPLEGLLNSANWESQVSVSCDGSTLYFASIRPGGVGGSDLWYSKKRADGTWSAPINLGININTEMDEESPFITNDGKTLYFSSNGHLGLGDQDIFVSWLEPDGRWSKPRNMGPPINSGYRELGFFLSASGQNAYFSSDRTEGYGGMDIYKLEMTEELHSDPITFVEGLVTDSILNLKLPCTVYIKGRDPVLTDSYGRFFLCVKANDTLEISINKDNYKPYKKIFAIPEWENKDLFELDIKLQSVYGYISFTEERTKRKRPPRDSTKKEPVIREKPNLTDQHSHTVFFNFDSFDLNPNEEGKIQRFLERLAVENVKRVEIIGYADDIGKEIYNLQLSEERAKNTALFLMVNDIVVDQIYLEGKGEIKDDKPKNQNRRVEIKVYTEEKNN